MAPQALSSSTSPVVPNQGLTQAQDSALSPGVANSILISNSQSENSSISVQQFAPQGSSGLETLKIMAELVLKSLGLLEASSEKKAEVVKEPSIEKPHIEKKGPEIESKEVVSEKASLSFSEKLTKDFADKAGGEIHEDELQQAIIGYQLYQKDPALEGRYLELLAAAGEKGLSTSEACVDALCKMVQEGLLEPEEAKWVNGLSFRAAQLDADQSALAGEGAKSGYLKVEDAIKIAEASLAGIQAGGVKAEHRELVAPSSVTTSSVTASSVTASSVTASSVTGAETFRAPFSEEQSGFLWKPVSEGDGNLVVLLPQSFNGSIESVSLYGGDSVADLSLIEEGAFSGDSANGNRSHFRFDSPGESYGSSVTLGVRLSDGRNIAFEIGNPSQRLSY